jgi:hypothetical protein
MSPRRLAPPALIALFSLISGCPGKPNDCPYARCDIRDAQCQAAIWASTECVRGKSEGGMPPIQMLTVDQFADEKLARDFWPEGNEEAWEASLHMLQILGSQDRLEETMRRSAPNGTSAYYDEDAGVVKVVDRQMSMQTWNVVSELAGAMAMAIQDRTHDLSAFTSGPDFDARLARRSAAEGAALVFQIAYGLNLTTDNTFIDWSTTFENFLTGLRATEPSAPVYTSALLIPNAVGGRPTADRYQRNGSPASFEGAFDHPPGSMVELMRDPLDGEQPIPRVEVTCSTSAPELTKELDEHIGPTFLYSAPRGLRGFGRQARSRVARSHPLGERGRGDRVVRGGLCAGRR